MPQRNTSNTYTGPSVREMISSHTLAREVIARHDDACPIFDDDSILDLRRFARDPAQARDILRERGLLDGEGEELGAGANAHGSLSGLILATWGTDRSVLTERELGELRAWFAGGGGRTDGETAAAGAGEA
ncbi:hypothetical protein B0T25DRAFT_542018 [Lasiosphaeria hispida]|uniref:Uncharacterized protein n=1 Tax=Lasiosphaeria hispida TaxID=260671 RepID=A0AAJ0MDJ0_9PEZI|nr:hypothetical protein B0T25DRAFT_542018 [Lasiosphaeria hispida]